MLATRGLSTNNISNNNKDNTGEDNIVNNVVDSDFINDLSLDLDNNLDLANKKDNNILNVSNNKDIVDVKIASGDLIENRFGVKELSNLSSSDLEIIGNKSKEYFTALDLYNKLDLGCVNTFTENKGLIDILNDDFIGKFVKETIDS
jgi:hypothetical protein